jgi:hypothetical protein
MNSAEYTYSDSTWQIAQQQHVQHSANLQFSCLVLCWDAAMQAEHCSSFLLQFL